MASKILHQVTECPSCHSLETVARRALAELPKSNNPVEVVDAHPAIERAIKPLEEPRLSGVMVKVLVVSYDVCANCGTRYSTRSEIVTSMVQAAPRT